MKVIDESMPPAARARGHDDGESTMRTGETKRSGAEPGAGHAVGRGRPPAATRFQPGRSGNPRGRPKGARGIAGIVAAALREPVEVTENGRRRRITKLEAAVKQLVNRAAAGETRVTRLLLGLAKTHEARPGRTSEFSSEADAAVIAGLISRLTEPR